MRPITYAPVAVEQTQGADGSIVLRSRMPLGPFEVNLAKMFRAAVETAPARAVFAERVGHGLAQDHLCGSARAGRRDRGCADRARALRRAPAHDPVRQRHRSRAAHAGAAAPPAFRSRRSRSPIRCRARITASSRTSPSCSSPGWSMSPIPRRSPRRCRARPGGRRGGGQRERRAISPRVTPFDQLAATHARARASSRRSPRSRPTPSPSSCSPRARPACPRA